MWNVLYAERSTGKPVANYRADQSVIIYDSRYTLGSNNLPLLAQCLDDWKHGFPKDHFIKMSCCHHFCHLPWQFPVIRGEHFSMRFDQRFGGIKVVFLLIHFQNTPMYVCKSCLVAFTPKLQMTKVLEMERERHANLFSSECMLTQLMTIKLKPRY